MRINHNMPSATYGTQLQSNRSTNQNLEKLSTGLRINRGIACENRAISDQKLVHVHGANNILQIVKESISSIKSSNTPATDVTSILHRMRLLADQSSEAVRTEHERNVSNQEYKKLIDHIDQITEVSEYSCQKLPEVHSVGEHNSQTNISAFVKRLEQSMNNLLVSETNLSAAESQNHDLNFVQKTSDSAENTIHSKGSPSALVLAKK